MANSEIGFGAKIAINDGTAGAFVDYPGTCTLSIPKQEYGEYEEKKLSTASKIRIFKPTLLDAGDITVESYWSKADYARILAINGVEGTIFKGYSPDLDGAGALVDQMFTMSGWVKSVSEVKFEKDKETMFTFVVRVVTFAIADGANNPAPAS